MRGLIILEIQGFAEAYHFGKETVRNILSGKKFQRGFLKGVPYGWIRFWLVNCMVPEGGRISIGPGAAGICMV